MLERIALHQTRLETPGLSLDARGIALGTKGLVLLQSIDRLVALLAVYTRDRSLEDLIAGLAVYVVRSKLGTREMVLEFSAESSDRMDLFADIARLVNGLAFTGTSRHFVQYRDAAAPFGYDVSDLRATDATLILHHTLFSQEYEVEQSLDLRGLLLRLTLRIEPGTKLNPGPRILLAEQGLGPALCHYLVRSHVPGECASCNGPRRVRLTTPRSAIGCCAWQSCPIACAPSCTPRPGFAVLFLPAQGPPSRLDSVIPSSSGPARYSVRAGWSSFAAVTNLPGPWIDCPLWATSPHLCA